MKKIALVLAGAFCVAFVAQAELQIVKNGTSDYQVVIDKIREHSRKPNCVRDRIIELCGDLPRIELFARQKTPGWDSWGNEI